MAANLIVMSVTDQDASTAGKSRQALAQDYAGRIGAALSAYRHEYSLKSLILGGVYTSALYERNGVSHLGGGRIQAPSAATHHQEQT